MIDFSALFRNPSLLLFGAAAQFGIFMTMVLAALLGYDIREAASIGIIGAADGPTSIVVASRFAQHLLGPISVAAYSYMALVPIIQPPVIKLLTSRKERLIRMTTDSNKQISKKALIAFPIVITVASGIIAPSSLALIGFLMFGNLIRECGVLNKLSLSAQNELSSLVTILLGITIASTMTAERFIRLDTLVIIGLGLFAFVFDTFGGVIFAKFLNIFRKEGNKNKSNDWCMRHICFSNVSSCNSSNGTKRRSLQLSTYACDKCKCGWPDWFCSSGWYNLNISAITCMIYVFLGT